MSDTSRLCIPNKTAVLRILLQHGWFPNDFRELAHFRLTALLGAFAQWVSNPSRAAVIARTAVAVLVLWNAGFIFQWGTHLVPARGPISWPEMVHNQVAAVPVRLTHGLESYFLHRKEMMRQIEREDDERQRIQEIQGQ